MKIKYNIHLMNPLFWPVSVTYCHDEAAYSRAMKPPRPRAVHVYSYASVGGLQLGSSRELCFRLQVATLAGRPVLNTCLLSVAGGPAGTCSSDSHRGTREQVQYMSSVSLCWVCKYPTWLKQCSSVSPKLRCRERNSTFRGRDCEVTDEEGWRIKISDSIHYSLEP